jgi:hypothetical protein
LNILLVYNEEVMDIKDVLNSFKNIAPSLNFTLEMEQDNKLNFLDLTISKTVERVGGAPQNPATVKALNTTVFNRVQT